MSAPLGITDAMGSLSLSSREPTRFEAPQVVPGLNRILTVIKAHEDDIHGIIQLPDNTFVTGSKDGSLIKWNFEKRQRTPIMQPHEIDYRNWITALTVLDDETWISGNRRGRVTQRKNDGTFVADLGTRPFQAEGPNHKCKTRNINRVNCLASFKDQASRPFFFAGWPTQFTLHDYQTKRRLNYTKTCENDWVYAVSPISKTSILVVTGCRLDLWVENTQNHRWNLHTRLIEEDRTKKPRPYISAVTPIEGFKNLFGLAVFDGSVKIMDVETGKLVFDRTEHDKRVWTIENTQKNCFASCGDDGTIKLWDIRQKTKSIRSVVDNHKEKARVSVLHRHGDQHLISGSCPDDVRSSANKAQICIWDFRR